MKTLLNVSLFVLLTAAVSFSQNPGDIVTDRPDQTESPDIVPPGYVQVEGGFNYSHFSFTEDNVIKVSGNDYNTSSLIRIGIFPSTEIRISPEYMSQSGTVSVLNQMLNIDYNSGGFLPLVVGAKIKITDESKYIPAAAFLFQSDIPEISSGSFTGGISSQEFRVALSKSLSDRFSLGVNTGIEYAYQTSGLYTVSLGAGITDKLGGFVELYGDFSSNTEPHHYIDGGLTYRILRNLQVDVSAGTSYTDDATNFFIGGGISARLPR